MGRAKVTLTGAEGKGGTADRRTNGPPTGAEFFAWMLDSPT
jgi:hypothetical protein